MKYTKEWLINEEKEGKTFKYRGFWGNKNDSELEKSFSNFYKSKFEAILYNGESFVFECNEQYFMYRKALEFKDYKIISKILVPGLKSSDYKDLGRMVQNYSDEIWNSVRYQAMVDGLMMKFSQNQKLKNYILSTNNELLVEASPSDVIWGCGFAKKDRQGKPLKQWRTPSTWKGENLLGFALMEVRDNLRNQ